MHEDLSFQFAELTVDAKITIEQRLSGKLVLQ